MSKKLIVFCSWVMICVCVCTVSFAQDLVFRPLRFYDYSSEPAAPRPFSAESEAEENDFPLFWAVFLNLIPGFGLGSFLQKNIFSGIVQLTLNTVPFAYGMYEAVEIMRDWHPASYIAFPFVAIWPIYRDVWPLFVEIGGRLFGIVSAVIYHLIVN